MRINKVKKTKHTDKKLKRWIKLYIKSNIIVIKLYIKSNILVIKLYIKSNKIIRINIIYINHLSKFLIHIKGSRPVKNYNIKRNQILRNIVSNF